MSHNTFHTSGRQSQCHEEMEENISISKSLLKRMCGYNMLHNFRQKRRCDYRLKLFFLFWSFYRLKLPRILWVHSGVNVIIQCKHLHLEMPHCLKCLKPGTCLGVALKKIQPISQEQTIISLSCLLGISLLELHTTGVEQDVCTG